MNDYRDFLPFLRREIALLEQSRFDLTFHQMHRVNLARSQGTSDKLAVGMNQTAAFTFAVQHSVKMLAGHAEQFGGAAL